MYTHIHTHTHTHIFTSLVKTFYLYIFFFRFYSDKWRQEGEGRFFTHMDAEISTERNNCFKRLFPNEDDRIRVNNEYAVFSLKSGLFGDSYILKIGGLCLVHIHLYFKGWLLECLDNLLLPLVVKEIGVLIL